MKDTGKEKEAPKKKRTSNPYDGVFRTMLNDCSSLIIPLVNEMFHEHYLGSEKIVFEPNEHFINKQDGKTQERITDTHFIIYGDSPKSYHLECQSSDDKSMLVRMFEYDAQIALDRGEIINSVLEVKFPNSAILFLRSNASTPDKMQIKICVGEESLYQDIPAMKVKDYSLEDIFEKKLLFLIPFYIFTHEGRLEECNRDSEKLEALKEEYEQIKDRLERMSINNEINEYTKRAIQEMSYSVLENLAKEHDNVKKGVKDVMLGPVMDYEAKRILNQGIEQGIEQGMELANIDAAKKMLRVNMQISVIMEITNLSEKKVEGLREEMIMNGELKEEVKKEAKKDRNKEKSR